MLYILWLPKGGWKLHAISSQHCQPDSPCINVFTPLSRPSWASSSSSPNSTAASWSSPWSTWPHLSLNHPPCVSSCPYPSVPEQSLPLIPNPTHSLHVSVPCLCACLFILTFRSPLFSGLHTKLTSCRVFPRTGQTNPPSCLLVSP